MRYREIFLMKCLFLRFFFVTFFPFFLLFFIDLANASDDLQRIDSHPERGWYFYESAMSNPFLFSQSLNANKKPLSAQEAQQRCQQPITWNPTCGFIDPTALNLSSEAAYQFEQREYKGLMHQYALYPNDATAVYRFQQFNHWVVNQAMTAAYAWQYNLAQHPDVDANADVPLSQFSEQVLRHLEDQSEQGFWQSLAKSAFFVFASKSDDPSCLQQSPLLRLLEKETQVAVWDFSMDKNQLPDATRVIHYPDLPLRQRKAIATQLQLDWLPTLYLYLKPLKKSMSGQWIRVTNGLTALSEIKIRTLNFVTAYRHAMIKGSQKNSQTIVPDFRANHLYPLLPTGVSE